MLLINFYLYILKHFTCNVYLMLYKRENFLHIIDIMLFYLFCIIAKLLFTKAVSSSPFNKF